MAARGKAVAWIGGLAHRIGMIPWRSISYEGVDRIFLVAKTLCAVHVFNSYICSFTFMLGPSMLPTFNLTGDVVAVDRITARWGSIAVGDVVVFQSPENPRKTVTKRVLGIEGDSVTYLVDPGHGDESKTVVVPKGHVWVEGDNSYNSRDSRQFGPLPYGLIQGRAFCRERRSSLPLAKSRQESNTWEVV